MKQTEKCISACYIHIPFCKNICTYCDFCKMYYNQKFISKYLEALDLEINIYYKNEVLKTLYIGGGTPSCLEKEELERLFKTISKIKLDKNYEFTFECNLNDITEELLTFLKDNKVNRLSIGIESFNEKILNVLGRKYDFNINEKIILAKKYFSNINIDLIYGVKGQTLEDLKEDLEKFTCLDIEHISIYSLILEENTILKTTNYQEIEDELCREMYDYICKFLKENGFNHYEISNFSKVGKESKHNLTYWNNNQYYGFGLGASGYIDNMRYTNTRSITNYNKGLLNREIEHLTLKEDMENFMILGLRKTKGVSNKEFFSRYNRNIKDVFDTNKLIQKDDYFFIKEGDLYISNMILTDFIN